MYTNFFVQQILHAYDRDLIGKEVCELGKNSWDTRLNGLIKAHRNQHVCETASEFFRSQGSKLTQYTRTPPSDQTTVLGKDVFENSIDVLYAMKSVHDITAPLGTMLINCPIGVHHHIGSISIAGMIFLAQKNNYNISYLSVSNDSGHCVERINSEAEFTTSKLTNLLYKFKESADLRIAANLTKTSDQEFKT
ncbi:hypothetical protein N9J19_00375 [bacterium]|nr:hypothetical protein [bacterium]